MDAFHCEVRAVSELQSCTLLESCPCIGNVALSDNAAHILAGCRRPFTSNVGLDFMCHTVTSINLAFALCQRAIWITSTKRSQTEDPLLNSTLLGTSQHSRSVREACSHSVMPQGTLIREPIGQTSFAWRTALLLHASNRYIQ